MKQMGEHAELRFIRVVDYDVVNKQEGHEDRACYILNGGFKNLPLDKKQMYQWNVG